jgi:anti-sigma28 factor (negative regulator of flagellin synthesis)
MVSKLTSSTMYHSQFKPLNMNQSTNDSKVSSANNIDRTDKVQLIKEKIQSGTYNLDMSRVARVLADELI